MRSTKGEDSKKALVCYFSYTGNTRKAAAQFQTCLSNRYDVNLLEIRPKRKRSYLAWLAYSFLPYGRVDIENLETDVHTYDLVCLGSPKWTFSCPPFNEYVRRMTGCEAKAVVLFVTFGGFRIEDFTRRTFRRIEEKSPRSISILVLARRNIIDSSYQAIVRDFCSKL